MKRKTVKTFYLDAMGSNQNGDHCGYGWIRTDKEVQRVTRATDLTNNQSAYWALLDVLKYVAPGSRVLVFTSSQILAYQFSGQYQVSNEQLLLLLTRVRNRTSQKRLDVDVRWVPREKNPAWGLVESSLETDEAA